MDDKELRELAKKRADFKQHLAAYIPVIAFLTLINYWFSPYSIWVHYVAIFWGFFIVLAGLGAYAGFGSFSEEEEYRKLKKKARK